MPHIASALVRRRSGWEGEEVDLSAAEDLDGVVEELRRFAGDDAKASVLFVEEDDEWLAIVRADEDTDPRVFLSDGRSTETSKLAGLFGEAAAVVDDVDDSSDDDEDDDDDEDEDDGVVIAGEPVGDADLLSDLGVPAVRLLTLCAEEGQLPGDVISAVCEGVGCLDALESLRAV